MRKVAGALIFITFIVVAGFIFLSEPRSPERVAFSAIREEGIGGIQDGFSTIPDRTISDSRGLDSRIVARAIDKLRLSDYSETNPAPAGARAMIRMSDTTHDSITRPGRRTPPNMDLDAMKARAGASLPLDPAALEGLDLEGLGFSLEQLADQTVEFILADPSLAGELRSDPAYAGLSDEEVKEKLREVALDALRQSEIGRLLEHR